MKTDDEVKFLRVPLDGLTADRLKALSDMCHSDPERVAASLLHDVLQDDADTHFLEFVEPPSEVRH